MEDNRSTVNSEEIRKKIRRSFTLLVFSFGIPVLLIFFTIFRTQFVEGPYWRALAKKQVREDVEVPPSRGNIFARDGSLMASTVPVYALYMDFQAPKADTFLYHLPALCRQLSEKLGDRSPEGYRHHLMKGYQARSREYLITRTRVSHTDLREIQKFALFKKGRFQSGLYEKKYYRREKPYGSLASRTIGDIYGEFEKGGKNGLELQYDSLLRGKPGLSIRQKVAGKYISVITQEPVDGYDVHTTIDVAMQDIVETALIKELSRINATSGSVVLMKVKTGEVLAISNMARADSGFYVESQNFAFSDKSEPGSTFKTFSMMVALEDGVVQPGDSVDTGNGVRLMYGSRMVDHNAHRGGYHMITAAKSIWYSSNVGISYFIDKFYAADPAKFVDGLYKIGLNKPMNLEIPGAANPYIPHPNDSRYWAKTDLPWMSIGYVTQIPPIYTLAFYNAIANDGELMKPYFVHRLTHNGNVVKSFKPKTLNARICSSNTLKEIRLMLDSVVGHGTGGGAKTPVVAVAGKTGTAQLSKGSQGYRDGGKSHQVSFCGYFPADEPEYSAIVVVREPRTEQPSGGKQAGGIFREIAERIYSRSLYQNPKDVDDTTRLLVPPVKSGPYKTTKRLLDEFDIKGVSQEVNDAQWVKSASSTEHVLMHPLDVSAKLVPDVRSMGARDAVYLLGNMGLQVQIVGRGKVVRQSITPGSFYNAGQSILLTLD